MARPLLGPVHFENRTDIQPASASCTVHIQIIPGKTGSTQNEPTRSREIHMRGVYIFINHESPWSGGHEQSRH